MTKMDIKRLPKFSKLRKSDIPLYIFQMTNDKIHGKGQWGENSIQG
ncbi:Uncharacterized protein dnm_041970 [Desulfonema magnum]|uniref:Uncharacterized protein n=1 Tax=Desulfonema magnum TaxID=45655 RepID=A0A975BMT1_9BACT|nr:Uncharacterized protein dnm_041970 [Desulfonema magnum]